MNKRGFTLIELLAVVFLLGFLAIIIFPNLVGNFQDKEVTIDQATKDILFSSVDRYMEAYGDDYDKQTGVTYSIAISDIDNEGLIPIDVDKYIDKCIEVKIGNTNSYKIVECPDRSIVDLSPIYSSANVRQKGVKGVAYFNPADPTEACDEDNSIVGSGTSSCMKWYIYDDSGSRYKMILDHNTANGIVWNSSNSNVAYEQSGAYTSIQSLGWSSNLSPTLITVDEVNTMTGKTEFDSANADHWYYLDSLNQTRTANSQGASQYAWLYDNTEICTTYGCSRAFANSGAGGYWTKNTRGASGTDTGVWGVFRIGALSYNSANETGVGVRPVITVPKNKFTIKD